MKDVLVDREGNNRCWKCGGRNFTLKRTTRAKVAVGVGALLTKKKLKCQQCGEYNDVGNAKPFETSSIGQRLSPQPQGQWHPDPLGRHELRWWDGQRWTAQVLSAGQPGYDEAGA